MQFSVGWINEASTSDVTSLLEQKSPMPKFRPRGEGRLRGGKPEGERRSGGGGKPEGGGRPEGGGPGGPEEEGPEDGGELVLDPP